MSVPNICSSPGPEFLLVVLSSQTRPTLSRKLQPQKRSLSTVPTPRPPDLRTESPCPDDANDALPQVPEPQPRLGQLQQLRSSLSLRLSSLDPGWLERCHNRVSDLLEVPGTCGLDPSAKESQPQMSGRVDVDDPDIHPEVSSQSPEALAQQESQVLSQSPKSSNSKNRKRKWNEKGEDFAQGQHSSQAGPLCEGAGATAPGQDSPGEPTQVNAAQPCHNSSQARTEKAKGTTNLHVSPRPASLDRGNYIRLNMKSKRFVRVGASRGRLLRKQVRCAEGTGVPFLSSHPLLSGFSICGPIPGMEAKVEEETSSVWGKWIQGHSGGRLFPVWAAWSLGIPVFPAR